ncbi:hypothetical protein TRFO_13434 [Tritrichomonas foetus]|uniref:Uncharacterized protein n=1 Tax=Tritrichomonas foetus TaxID=1144522 RepID=A0A1J4KXY6_9EUKA|nr:hypothetical protein TRFO_13434 [Tritrichomonas foetus]|eukprot:OHT16113.1 hypothetical protein TRFO_13434 [Tritrichomonas foetus]
MENFLVSSDSQTRNSRGISRYQQIINSESQSSPLKTVGIQSADPLQRRPPFKSGPIQENTQVFLSTTKKSKSIPKVRDIPPSMISSYSSIRRKKKSSSKMKTTTDESLNKSEIIRKNQTERNKKNNEEMSKNQSQVEKLPSNSVFEASKLLRAPNKSKNYQLDFDSRWEYFLELKTLDEARNRIYCSAFFQIWKTLFRRRCMDRANFQASQIEATLSNFNATHSADSSTDSAYYSQFGGHRTRYDATNYLNSMNHSNNCYENRTRRHQSGLPSGYSFSSISTSEARVDEMQRKYRRGNQSFNNQSFNNHSFNNQSFGNQSFNNQSFNNQSFGNQSFGNNSSGFDYLAQQERYNGPKVRAYVSESVIHEPIRKVKKKKRTHSKLNRNEDNLAENLELNEIEQSFTGSNEQDLVKDIASQLRRIQHFNDFLQQNINEEEEEEEEDYEDDNGIDDLNNSQNLIRNINNRATNSKSETEEDVFLPINQSPNFLANPKKQQIDSKQVNKKVSFSNDNQYTSASSIVLENYGNKRLSSQKTPNSSTNRNPNKSNKSLHNYISDNMASANFRQAENHLIANNSNFQDIISHRGNFSQGINVQENLNELKDKGSSDLFSNDVRLDFDSTRNRSSSNMKITNNLNIKTKNQSHSQIREDFFKNVNITLLKDNLKKSSDQKSLKKSHQEEEENSYDSDFFDFQDDVGKINHTNDIKSNLAYNQIENNKKVTLDSLLKEEENKQNEIFIDTNLDNKRSENRNTLKNRSKQDTKDLIFNKSNCLSDENDSLGSDFSDLQYDKYANNSLLKFNQKINKPIPSDNNSDTSSEIELLSESDEKENNQNQNNKKSYEKLKKSTENKDHWKKQNEADIKSDSESIIQSSKSSLLTKSFQNEVNAEIEIKKMTSQNNKTNKTQKSHNESCHKVEDKEKSVRDRFFVGNSSEENLNLNQNSDKSTKKIPSLSNSINENSQKSKSNVNDSPISNSLDIQNELADQESTGNETTTAAEPLQYGRKESSKTSKSFIRNGNSEYQTDLDNEYGKETENHDLNSQIKRNKFSFHSEILNRTNQDNFEVSERSYDHGKYQNRDRRISDNDIYRKQMIHLLHSKINFKDYSKIMMNEEDFRTMAEEARFYEGISSPFPDDLCEDVFTNGSARRTSYMKYSKLTPLIKYYSHHEK